MVLALAVTLPGSLLADDTSADNAGAMRSGLKQVDFKALGAAIRDLRRTFPHKYTGAEEYLRRLESYEKRLPEIYKSLAAGDEREMVQAGEFIDEVLAFQRYVLPANPLVSGQPIVTLPTPYVVAGCTFPPPPAANGPCVTAQWVTSATRVTSNGLPVLLFDSQAICAPTGTPLVILSTQTRVTGM